MTSNGQPARLVGHGPGRVLFSHGWIADHSLFDPVVERLDPARFTCALVDGRGYGRRRTEAGPCSIAALAADLLAVADELGWKQFHIVGHSMGGMAAQRLLIDIPRRLQSAVLLAPVPASGARLDEARRALLQRAILEPAARRELIDRNSGGRRPAAWLDRMVRLSLATTTAPALEAYLAAWADTDFSAEVIDAGVPIHVLLGELEPEAVSTRLRETVLRWHSSAQLSVLAGVGHYPMQEDPEELSARLTRLLGDGR
jgi:pimeloyl-ACP methyl ester carboxylesterase